jgi:hypothetical protein
MKTQEQIIIKTKKQKGVIALMFSCFNVVLNTVTDMEKRGVSEVARQGEVNGKTEDGRDIKVKYGYGVKVGLDDFAKKLKERK